MPFNPKAHAWFDSTLVTFDNTELTWDTCGYEQQAEIIQQQLKIENNLTLVLNYGPGKTLYSLLDLYPDTAISIKFLSPLFNDTGTHSFPFTLPATKQNLKILGFPHRIERYQSVKDIQYPLQIFAGGLLILDGNLVITEADPLNIECYFKSGNGDFWSAIEGKTLKDIELGESEEFADDAEALDYMKDATEGAYPDFPFAIFPLVNIGLAKDLTWTQVNAGTGGTWLGITMVNYWNVDDPGNPYFMSQWCSLSPYLYLNYILDRLFYTFGYTPSKNFISISQELRTLVMYNNTSKWWSDNPLFLFPMPGTRPNKFNYRDYVPDCDIAAFIENLEKMFCACLFVDHRTKKTKFLLFKEIITAIEVVSLTKIVSDIRITQTESYDSAVFKFSNDSEAYPEDDIKDFRELNKWASVFSQLPAITTEDLNDLRLVRASDIYFRVSYGSSALEWKLYSRNIQKEYGYPGENPLEVECNIFTLPMYYGADVFLGVIGTTKFTHISWPLAIQKNFFELRNADEDVKDNYSPRLLFYRGLHQDQSTPQNTYPLGTFDVYDTNKINGSVPKLPDANLSLRWDGPYGLIENFYKEYLQWKMAGPDKLEFEAWFDITEIAALDFSKKYAINNTHLLLDSVELTLTPEGITASKVTAYKL